MKFGENTEMKMLPRIALIIAGGFWIYNLGVGGGIIDFFSVLPPIFLIIAGALLLKSTS